MASPLRWRSDGLRPWLGALALIALVATAYIPALDGGFVWDDDYHVIDMEPLRSLHGLGEITDRLGAGREADIVAGINQCFTAVENSIRRFGGVVNKIDLYEHGDKLLAFFGAPVAHEDDAERAVRAALAMQEALTETACSLPAQLGLPDL